MVDFDLSLVINTEQSHPYSLLKESATNSEDGKLDLKNHRDVPNYENILIITGSLQQTTQPNLETEKCLTNTSTPLMGTDVSSRVLEWVEDQQSRIRRNRPGGDDTDVSASIDSD